MPNEPVCTRCFGSLSVASRMKIYEFLKEHKRCSVSDVVAVVRLKQPTVSYHLKEMKEAGLLESVKKGKEVFYSVRKGCTSGNTVCVLTQFSFKGNSDAKNK